jgi:hypothetical protein
MECDSFTDEVSDDDAVEMPPAVPQRDEGARVTPLLCPVCSQNRGPFLRQCTTCTDNVYECCKTETVECRLCAQARAAGWASNNHCAWCFDPKPLAVAPPAGVKVDRSLMMFYHDDCYDKMAEYVFGSSRAMPFLSDCVEFVPPTNTVCDPIAQGPSCWDHELIKAAMINIGGVCSSTDVPME